jgi:hypothetical protein
MHYFREKSFISKALDSTEIISREEIGHEQFRKPDTEIRDISGTP